MKQFEDIILIEGCLKNDRYFQEALYKQFFSKMMSMCMRHSNGNKEIALEMLNIGMLKVFQNLAKFEFRGSFEGWIRRIVYNGIIDYHKQNEKHTHFMIFEEKDVSIIASGLQNCYVEDILSLVEQLPSTTQKVFKLYAIDGYSHKEIGEELNISDGTSKWHLSNAREKLKHMLENQYFAKVKNII